MPLKVLIAPDKFKGTLTAHAAAEAIARGWHAARPLDRLDLLPISDGGDGFGEILSRLLAAQPQRLKTVDAAGRPLAATWWWESKSRTAIIESARIIGLALLPPGKFHPFQLDTRGLAAAFSAAARKGARLCLVGIGGSATNDGGFGLARALNWQLLDHEGKTIERWTELHRLALLQPPAKKFGFKVLIAVDVQNRLLGARGCSRIYGPQKGLRPQDFSAAEKCLRSLSTAVQKQLGRASASELGSGAAGGLGFGLHAFMGGQLVSGFDLLARHAQLGRHLRGTDLAITGEGALDRSTLMGKGVGELALLCKQRRITCIGLAGRVDDHALLHPLFAEARGLTQITTPKESIREPARYLEKLAELVARDWRTSERSHSTFRRTLGR